MAKTKFPKSVVEKLIAAHAIAGGVRVPASTDAEAIAEIGVLLGNVLREIDPAYKLADHVAEQMRAA